MRTIIFISALFCCINTSAQDSVIISASIRYEHPSLFRKFLLGSNYRDTWSAPVKMPVFRLDTSRARIVEMGGGQQTKSLKIIDSDSIEWVLRTVDKDVEKALPGFFRNTFIERVVQDMISGAHPYAALAVGELARKLDLAAPYPQVYYVADDPGLGPYREILAHKVCMLEKSEPTYDDSEAIDTEDMLSLVDKKGNRSINDTLLLKARLLDMLVGDWDRHHEQWKWGASGDEYYPVPRDRDQAFFYSNGFLVKLVGLFSMKHLVGFRPQNRKVKHLNRKSWKFDRYLMSELDENDWLRAINQFTSTLTNDALHQAVQKLPKEIYKRDGQRILTTLIERRDAIGKDAMKYYYWLSRNIYIRGSDDPELVKVTPGKNGLHVQVVNSLTNHVTYDRIFNPRITKKINLYLMDGNDRFIAQGAEKSRIKILLNDGEGEDHVQNNGKLDLTTHNNALPSIAWRE